MCKQSSVRKLESSGLIGWNFYRKTKLKKQWNSLGFRRQGSGQGEPQDRNICNSKLWYLCQRLLPEHAGQGYTQARAASRLTSLGLVSSMMCLHVCCFFLPGKEGKGTGAWLHESSSQNRSLGKSRLILLIFGNKQFHPLQKWPLDFTSNWRYCLSLEGSKTANCTSLLCGYNLLL